jgi:DNA ligase 1
VSHKSPMLAERESAHLWSDKLKFPLFGTPKLDGIRCMITTYGTSDNVAVSRKFIPIANNHIRETLSHEILAGLDGELVVGPVNAENVFNQTTGAVMGNRVKQPDFTYHVFDTFLVHAATYADRMKHLHPLVTALQHEGFPVRFVPGAFLTDWAAVEAYESSILAEGFEGVILRSPDAGYKFGRSTKREQGMLKLKRFTDSEAEIIGFEELYHNTNADIRDALGHAKRSTAQAGLVAGGTLGKLVCRDLTTGVEFQIGMFKGLTAPEKQSMWDRQDEFIGKIVKYQHFSHGAIDKPRHSKFLGFRDSADM